MKFIDSSVEIMKEENPLIKIEKIGRICYKSESDYTIDTAISFIKGLIKRGHMSVLEHAVFVFEGAYSAYRGKPFVNCTYVCRKDFTRRLISCNLRAIIEQGYYDLQNALIKHYPRLSEIFDMEKLNGLNEYEFADVKLVNLLDYKNLTPEEAKAHLYTTFQFVTDRGVSHEMVRHRIASYTQESTRYCVAGDTLLSTSNPHNKLTVSGLFDLTKTSPNGSYRRIKIKQMNEFTGEFEYFPIKNIICNGNKEVYELKTELGYTLKCTFDHKIYTPCGYTELQNLSVGDKIYVNGIKVDREELYKNRDWLYYQNITLNKTFVQISKDFGYNVSTLKKWARKFNIPKKGTGYFNEGRSPWNKGLNEEDDPRVKIQAEALRTYHCDGRHDGETIILKDDTKVYQKHMLDKCECCGTTENLEVHHKDKDRENNDPSNLLTVCESCHQRIHNMSLEIPYEDKIVSIEKVGTETVYDIEMDSEYPNFVANGVVVHNCNYSNDKFGNELTFIRPATFDNWEPECRVIYMQSLEKAEKEYMELTAKGLPAQFARGVLPTDVKTIIVMTANYKEMNHFFDLRSRGVTGSPHPNMLRVASMADELFYTEYKELLENVYKEPMEKTLPID